MNGIVSLGALIRMFLGMVFQSVSSISVKKPAYGLNDLQILHFSNKWKEIGNIQKLKRRRVLRIKANGNCCWKIYKRKWLLGRYEHIYAGYDKYPRIQLKSLRKVDC